MASANEPNGDRGQRPMTTRHPDVVPKPQISPAKRWSSGRTLSVNPAGRHPTPAPGRWSVRSADVGWEQLRAGIDLPFDPAVTVPPLTEVELGVAHPSAVADVEAEAHHEVVRAPGRRRHRRA